MIKFFKIIIFFLIFFILVQNKVFAQSNYVLPYPSSMPGSFLYKAHVFYEKISKFWYFGDFGQFDYNLKLSDKYLVEAKTLFEYKQYLLGHNALAKSNQYYSNIFPNLVKAGKDGKNISQKVSLFKQASQKHIEILTEMENNNPNYFRWSPEKSSSTFLNLKKLINDSISLRKSYL